MALETPPTHIGSKEVSVGYRPKDGNPYPVKAGESFSSIAQTYRIDVWTLIEFNFPGCKKNPQVVNWYLRQHLNCRETRDGKNRVFRGGETIYIPPPRIVMPVSHITSQKNAAYNRQAAVAYAKKHALKHNLSEYITYPNDCTNFVSQCLFAGGWTMEGGFLQYQADSSWWYSHHAPVVKSSWPWAGAHNFSKFIKKSLRGRLWSDPLKLMPGDVVQLAEASGHVWHTMFVTDIGPGEIYLSYHTNDRLNNPWSTVMKMVKPGHKVLAWKISDNIV